MLPIFSYNMCNLIPNRNIILQTYKCYYLTLASFIAM